MSSNNDEDSQQRFALGFNGPTLVSSPQRRTANALSSADCDRFPLAYAPFPEADPAKLVEDTVTCVVQVRGKVRDRLEVPADVSAEELEALALASEKIVAFLDGAPVRQVVVRAPSLVNVVV